MGQIEDDVRTALAANNLVAQIVTRLAPAWTTDWIVELARQKLREFGIAPPHTAPPANRCVSCGRGGAPVEGLSPLRLRDTTETSHFGSTACKSLYKCLDCLEPFDYFKPY